MRLSPLKTIIFYTLSLLLILMPSGCGGHRNNPNRNLPAMFSMDRFRPNYGHDLDDAFQWQTETGVVTYRFPAPGTATSIRLTPIATVALTDRERQDARDGFSKWQAASGGRLQFREVDASDTTANIDMVVQAGSSFSGDLYGQSSPFLRDVGRGILGRCVIRVKDSLSERRFRHVVLHEIGHASGLQGHDRQYGAVMYPQSPEIIPLIELSERDRNTIQAIYARETRGQEALRDEYPQ